MSQLDLYVSAVSGGMFRYGLNESAEQVRTFFSRIERSEAALKENAIEIEYVPNRENIESVAFTSPIGVVRLNRHYFLDDKAVTAAMLFTDDINTDGRTFVRKLHAVYLRNNEEWVDSRGEVVRGQRVMDAVLLSFAAKFKADSEYVMSFSTSSRTDVTSQP